MRKFHAIVFAGAALLTASAASAQHVSARAATGDVQVAQLFGESDDEKAARLQHEQNQDSQISNLTNRVGDLEATVTRLTGHMEELDHRMAELKTRMERMQKDYDYKLCTIAAQQMGASTDSNDPNALPCAGASQQQGAQQQSAPQQNAPQQSAPQKSAPPIPLQAYTPAPSQGYRPPVTVNVPAPSTPMPQANAAPVHLAPPPGVLGTLPAGQANAPPPRSNGIETGMLPSVDAPSQFDSAKQLLAQAQYDEARAQFRGFVDAHPEDPRAPQALFWIGNISYAQKDYANASRSFAEGLKKYPASTVAPDTMLKLGQSLIAMNQKKEGCTFLGAIHAKYPAAPKTLDAQTLATRKAAGCR